MIGLVGDEIKVQRILEIMEDIKRYSFFINAKNLGITFRPNDLSFNDSLLFGWIEEATRKRPK